MPKSLTSFTVTPYEPLPPDTVIGNFSQMTAEAQANWRRLKAAGKPIYIRRTAPGPTGIDFADTPLDDRTQDKEAAAWLPWD